ncbi:hypothetical protein R3I93_002323 [Phoxinus phoxinus]|uniref:DUF6729 domain-containing protein n=1 Tax=Phoxinus phoxinus TaxID=58324 RepID=A0AAN9DLA8_9TELE
MPILLLRRKSGSGGHLWIPESRPHSLDRRAKLLLDFTGTGQRHCRNSMSPRTKTTLVMSTGCGNRHPGIPGTPWKQPLNISGAVTRRQLHPLLSLLGLRQHQGVPASRPALRPDLRPVEPSDAELVAVAIATENSLDIQVPVVTQTTTDPPQDPPGAAVRTKEQAVSRQSFPCPPPAHACPELLLPESWRAVLNQEQQQWIGRTLFTRGRTGRSQLTTELRLWWYPPQPRLIYSQPPASPDPFFACPLFLWMPLRMWSFKLTCTQRGCNTTLTKAGLYKTIRRV